MGKKLKRVCLSKRLTTTDLGKNVLKALINSIVNVIYYFSNIFFCFFYQAILPETCNLCVYHITGTRVVVSFSKF